MVIPLGVVSTVVSGTHDGCQVTLNGIERMGVSSSSEFSRVSCAVGKVFVCVDFHCVQWVVRGVLWFGEVFGYGC